MKILYFAELKKWLAPAMVTLLTCLLLYIGIDYPFLKGAGRAQADFEAVLLFLFLGLPCLVWSVIKLVWGGNSKFSAWERQVIARVAWGNIVGMLIFVALALSVIIRR